MKATKLAPGVNWKKHRLLIGVCSVVLVLFLLKGTPSIVHAYDVAQVNQALRETSALSRAGKTQEALAKLKTTQTRYMTDEQRAKVQQQTAALTPINYSQNPKGMSAEAFDQMLRDRGQQGILFPFTPSPTPNALPTRKLIAPSPAPSITPPSNPQVRCHYDDRCGGTKITTQSECTNTTCCFNGNTYEIKSKNDCQKQADEMAQKQAETWKTEYEQMKTDIESMQKTTAVLSQQHAQSQAELLELCREHAQKTYAQPFMGSQTTPTGYVVGESPELRQKLNQAMAQCLALYGGE